MMQSHDLNGKQTPTNADEWPTARAVAVRLGCSRQTVYKLEKRGKLRGHDARENGVKVRRFEPESVAALSEDSELETLLGLEPRDDDDDDETPPNAMRLAARVVAESRQVATDARRGQQEAFELVVKPAQTFTESLLRALEAREQRIASLEEKLNKVHDEQRQARSEERETLLVQAQLERADARKDQLFALFAHNLPMLVEQLKNSVGGGAGPFAAWMRACTPAQQTKLIKTIEAVLSDEPDPEPPAPVKGPADAP